MSHIVNCLIRDYLRNSDVLSISASAFVHLVEIGADIKLTITPTADERGVRIISTVGCLPDSARIPSDLLFMEGHDLDDLDHANLNWDNLHTRTERDGAIWENHADPVSGAILLELSLPVDQLDSARFHAALHEFAKVHELWSSLLAEDADTETLPHREAALSAIVLLG